MRESHPALREPDNTRTAPIDSSWLRLPKPANPGQALVNPTQGFSPDYPHLRLWMNRITPSLPRPLPRIRPWGVLVGILFACHAALAVTLTSVTPVTGSSGVPPGNAVVFTFGAPMDPAQTRAGFTNAAPPFTGIPVVSSWDATSTILTCTPSPAFPNLTGITWILTGRDQSGGSLTGTKAGFFTTGVGGGPAIASSTPANGASGIQPIASLVVRFTTAMNAGTVQVLCSASGTPAHPIQLTTNWNPGATEVTCVPTAPWPTGRSIVWAVSGSAASGAPLSAGAGSFATVTGAPRLASVIPTNGAPNVPAAGPVVFEFTQAMNPANTRAEFRAATQPGSAWPVAVQWNPAFTRFTCTPSPAFPGETSIQWSLGGMDAAGSAMTTAHGGFTTGTGSGTPLFPAAVALLSRGVNWLQQEADLIETDGTSFAALIQSTLTNTVQVASPVPDVVLTPSDTGWPALRETWAVAGANDPAATNHPAGTYTFRVGSAATAAELLLTDTSAPAPVQVAHWGIVPYTPMNQPWNLAWTRPAGGPPVHHVQVQVLLGERLVHASPLPGLPGALSGSATGLTVPASAFAEPGEARVRIASFTFTATNTTSLPAITLLAGRHSVTEFTLLVVNPATPPPALHTTRIEGVPTGEEFLNPVFVRNGVRPLRYEVVGGNLPPGLHLQPGGMLTGWATTPATATAQVRVTDLLGRSVTTGLTVTTAAIDAEPRPTLTRIRPGDAGTVILDVLVGAGRPCVVERSSDLAVWTPVSTTVPASGSISLTVPGNGEAGFYRLLAAPPGLPAPRPLRVNPVTDPAATVAARVDEFGGTLRLTNAAGYRFALVIPPGSLEDAEEIRMTALAQVGGLPLSGGLRGAVLLEPEGLLFDAPARLDITLPDGMPAGRMQAFGARTDGNQFALRPGFITNRTVSIPLTHFSLAGAGEGTSGDVSNQTSNSPDNAGESIDQDIAGSMDRCRADPDCANNPDKNQELISLYVKKADLVVIPALQKAAGNDEALDGAIATWIDWLRALQLLGLHDAGDFFSGGATPELASRITRAGSLATKALNAGITRACDDCIKHDMWRIYRMLKLTRTGALVGIDRTSDLWSCTRRCMVFEVELESEITAVRGEKTFTTKTKAKVKMKPLNPGGGALPPDDDAFTRIALRMFEGNGSWDITSATAAAEGCTFETTPTSGKFHVPLAKLTLYKKRQVWIPGEPEPRTVYTFDPDMILNLRSELSTKPAEKRVIECKDKPPTNEPDIFGPAFFVLHATESITPSGEEAALLGGGVFRMTGFTAGSPQGIIFSKPYVKQENDLTENTLIDVRHTPR